MVKFQVGQCGDWRRGWGVDLIIRVQDGEHVYT